MLKNRLIFTLLLEGDTYHLSRNFRLQKVGGLDWVKENYDFDSIARSIDELVVLDVSRETPSIDGLASHVRQLGEQCFMPLAAGGGIRSPDDARELFLAGADKIVLNTPYFKDPGLVRELVAIYGAQSVVASIDYLLEETGERAVYCDRGREKTGLTLAQAVERAQGTGVGELYVTSIRNDGTGDGYDLEGLAIAASVSSVPIIASGGAGNYVHFLDAFRNPDVKAASTANLFNFMGDGLKDARESMVRAGATLCTWAPF